MMAWLALIPGIGPVIAFLTSSVGRLVMIGALGAALLLGGEIHGRLAERAKCRAADLAMQLAAARRDAAISADAAANERAANEALAQQQSDLQQKVTAYEHELARRDSTACRLTPADVRRLRELR